MKPPAALRGGKPLRLLLLEDSDHDAALVLREMKRAGYELTSLRVQAQGEFKAAIESERWDVIVSDHTIPGYGGLKALRDLQLAGKDIPFILVSGTIGEAVAVRAMKAGAQDYVLKGDLTRLPAAVEREVRERALRAEQEQMREQIVISERMASAGLLAAGVAHEINNPLAVAVANLDFAAETLTRLVADARARAAGGDIDPAWQGVAELREGFDDAREALRRIRDIVRDVKVFSRPEDDVTRALDIRRVIDSAARMAWNEIRHRARLIKAYGDTGPVGANESRLGQVLLNLIVNAAQAIPEGDADRNEIRIATKPSPTGEVIVEVSDTGSGISKENLGRIFDPFFTTKPVGVGTGLGLAICHRLVAELGGHIAVESELGKGTLFRLTLPPGTGEISERTSTPPPAADCSP